MSFAEVERLVKAAKIACIGWGSLIWDPEKYPFSGKDWHHDGPRVRVEFARRGWKDPLSLVLIPGRPDVTVLWRRVDCTSCEETVKLLARREGIRKDRIWIDIGFWTEAKHSENEWAEHIGRWARRKNLDVVVWTALAYKWFRNRDKIPSAEELIHYLRYEVKEHRSRAVEEYVRRTPRQIRTPYRALIEKELGWKPEGDI